MVFPKEFLGKIIDLEKSCVRSVHIRSMGESFQGYHKFRILRLTFCGIQDFEADFLWKVSLKMLNKADFNSFSGLFSVHLRTIDYLTY